MAETIVKIDRLGHLGDGIAEGPVYAAGTLPGETITGDLSGDRVSGIRIIEPAPTRVRPPCRHARSCGGCTLQHASDDFLANWKSDIVGSALSAQGLLAEIVAVETSPARSRRRVTLHGQRTKNGSNIGLYAKNSHVLIDTPDCLLVDPRITAARPVLHELTMLGASRTSTISLSITVSDDGLDIAIDQAKEADRALLGQIAKVAGVHDIARLTWNGEVVAQNRQPRQRMGSAYVVPPPAAFLQATAHAQAALVTLVQDATRSASHVADLFAGCGTFALPLTRYHSVHAVEGEADLLLAAHRGWAEAGGLHRLSTEVRDLFRRPLVVEELDRFDAVVIDPPRAGATAQTAELARSRVPVIAAVSCNPATFARDAAALVAGGYKMGAITVIDQFRWSPHVELFAAFRRS